MQIRITLIAAAMGAAMTNSNASGQFSYERVAYSQATRFPGTNVLMQSFRQPVVSAGHVYFEGTRETDARAGLYEFFEGSLTTVADRTTLVPNSEIPFGSFITSANSMKADGRTLAFDASSTGPRGTYIRENDAIGVVVDSRDQSPYGDNFVGVRFRDYSNGAAAVVGFRQSGGLLRGAYRKENGVLSLIADTNTPVPNGTGTFQNTSGQFGSAAFVHNRVTFVGTDSANRSGIYQENGSSISRLFDTTMDASNGDGRFFDFGGITSGGDGNFAFIAGTEAAPDYAVYGVLNGQLIRLLTENTALGDGRVAVVSNGGFSFASDGSLVWFNGDGQGGVYTTYGGSIQPILRVGDEIDGKFIAEISFSTYGRDGDQVALFVRYTTDNPDLEFYDRAVYLVTLPGPGGGALMAGAAAAGLLGRRRK